VCKAGLLKGAALLELVVGIPLEQATTIQLARFSLFSLAPILSFVRKSDLRLLAHLIYQLDLMCEYDRL